MRRRSHLVAFTFFGHAGRHGISILWYDKPATASGGGHNPFGQLGREFWGLRCVVFFLVRSSIDDEDFSVSVNINAPTTLDFVCVNR